LLNLAGSGKLIFIFLLINYHAISNSQIIKGTVLDKDSNNPVSFAYLYFSGTFVGTQSDQNGNFELDVSKNNSIPLTVSAIGYYSTTLTGFPQKIPFTIYLAPKLYSLKEITVNAKSLVRRRKVNMTLFKDIFLGTTNNARFCEILNENDISFNYDSDKDTLKAYATKPILIKNMALGYSITYYLDKFEYDRGERSFTFKGTIIFNEDLNTDAESKQIYEKRRERAYRGSRMHFFRSLWNDDLKPAGFEVKDENDDIVKYNDIVVEDSEHNKFLTQIKTLKICYKSSVPSTGIEFIKNTIYFSGDGYFDSDGILWEGAMANLRIADWLPYEYSVK